MSMVYFTKWPEAYAIPNYETLTELVDFYCFKILWKLFGDPSDTEYIAMSGSEQDM
jgi:hypothetical protein